MRICHKCGLENPDSAKSCERCFSVLLNSASQSDEKRLAEFFEKQEKKERRNQIFKTIPIPVYVLIYLPVYIKCVLLNTDYIFSLLFFLLFPTVGYYLLAFKAEALFKLQHIFHIDNIDDVEVSDWYIFSSLIAGISLLIIGLFVVISTCISLTNLTDVIAVIKKNY